MYGGSRNISNHTYIHTYIYGYMYVGSRNTSNHIHILHTCIYGYMYVGSRNISNHVYTHTHIHTYIQVDPHLYAARFSKFTSFISDWLFWTFISDGYFPTFISDWLLQTLIDFRLIYFGLFFLAHACSFGVLRTPHPGRSRAFFLSTVDL
jgi:hypothetical protein